MSNPAPVRIRVEKNVITRVTRILRGKGIFNIQVGQQISPEEIIGTSQVSAGFRILNLAALLSVQPIDMETFLTKKIGQRIYRGELLAYKKGSLFGGKKVVTAPTDGVLDFLNSKTGELKIAFLPKKIDLPSGVYGIVELVDDQRGQVVIRTEVSRIYGLFGSGRLRDGILRFLGKRDNLISKDMIRTEYGGQILVGGSLFFKDTISAAISAGVSGIITGGINAKDYKSMAGGRLIFPKKLDNDIGTSIVVCEGFGSVPIGDDVFETLKEFEGKFVLMDGNKALISLPASSSNSLTKIKNTQLPPLPGNSVLEMDQMRENVELKVGMKVRIVGNSYLATQGKLLAINESMTLLPSKVKTYLAIVETTKKKIQIPVANLETMM